MFPLMKDDIQEKGDPTAAELSWNIFHLKTLYEVSRVLLDQGDIDKVLRNFLLMTMGSFGVVEGFAFMQEDNSLIPQKLVSVGIDEKKYPIIEKGCLKLRLSYDHVPTMDHVELTRRSLYFPPFITYVSVFNIAYACNGILGLGPKIVGEPYTHEDTELLETLIINLAVTLKNVRSTHALKSAFREVSSINQAKTKVIDHLSHELKTPISLLMTSLTLLRRHLSKMPGDEWTRSYDRAERSLRRLSGIQRGAEDIMRKKMFVQHRTAAGLLDECADILESFTAEQFGDSKVVDLIRKRIDDIYRPADLVPATIMLGDYVKSTLADCRNKSGHRHLDIRFRVESAKSITIPKRILTTIVVGLIKNAIENTPDEGCIDMFVKDTPKGVQLRVHDFGTGILARHFEHIFSGFYPTQQTDRYSTKQPYDFNAGGKGTDLLRIKIFSETYNFKIHMKSSRCAHMPTSQDICPGRISLCKHCQTPEDCHVSGSTLVDIDFF
jgi:signal transduction histidine kinase